VGVQAMRCGADDYLVKPLRESAVLASLERALHKRQLEQQVENYRQHLEEMVAERTEQLQAALQQVESSYEHTLQALGAAIDSATMRRPATHNVSAVTRSRLLERWLVGQTIRKSCQGSLSARYRKARSTRRRSTQAGTSHRG